MTSEPDPARDGATGAARSGNLVAILEDHPACEELAGAMLRAQRCVVTGSVGSSTALLAGALTRKTGRLVVLVVAHLDDADEAWDELTGAGVPVLKLPALETAPGETTLAADVLASRVRAAEQLPTLSGQGVLVAPIQALMQHVPPQREAAHLTRTIRRGDRVRMQDLVAWLSHAGFRRLDAVEEPGDFSVRGGIVDVFPPAPAALDSSGGEPVPIRLDFFGDEVDRVSEVDVSSMASDRAVDGVQLVAFRVEAAATSQGISALTMLPDGWIALLSETMEVVEQGRGYFERATDAKAIDGPPQVMKLLEARSHALAEVNQFSSGALRAETRIDLSVSPLPTFPKDASQAVQDLVQLARERAPARTLVCCQNEGELQRWGELLAEFAGEGGAPATLHATRAYLHRGFVLSHAGSPSRDVAVVPYHELVGRFGVRRGARGRGGVRAGRAMDTFLDFDEGDYVVHTEHGIARYAGLRLMQARELPVAQRAGSPKRTAQQDEYLVLEFAAQSRLHVPVTQADKVQKYVGGFSGKPALSTLGGLKWRTQKERVAESVRDLAAELLRVRAAREHLPGISYPHDTAWQKEFEAEFPYEETQDQLAALQEIKRDMHTSRPMDRLICGDVGFGKTELAIRAAFKAAEFGKQVAVLVPTTVLAEQHERTFRARFAGYPFRVESISRFKSDAEVRKVLADLRQGAVDVIVGTHRLLSQDVRFADLGLVIIDEEQRFGVEHKENLLRLRLTVDVLTLSATPIPRTLHMAMLGIRDISSLTTPPADRRAIVTEVIPFNAARVKQALERELSREGQAFVVHNRVYDILSFADDIQRLAPQARIVVGHGQMEPSQLEEVMLRFMRREADILVSTTIIESGIDIPTANTMIIDEADRFGLSDLHQLRGRVGRGKHRGYCYLLLPPDRAVKETAQKRLKALEQYSMLGAGFKIAMRDLEIRGAGNILGAEQSGHIAAVGYEMYCQLLEGAVQDIKDGARPDPVSSTTVEIGVPCVIPRGYIPSDKRRLSVYRRLATTQTHEHLAQAVKDVADAYGAPPSGVVTIFELAQLRLALAALGVRGVTIREKDVVFLCKDAQRLAHELALRAQTRAAQSATIRVLSPEEPGGLPMVYFRPPETYLEPATLLATLRARLGLPPVPIPQPAHDAQTPPNPRGSTAQGTTQGTTQAIAGSPARRPPPRGVRSRSAPPTRTQPPSPPGSPGGE